MRFFLILIVIFLVPLAVVGQDSIQVIQNTLDYQMHQAFEKSNSYQEYKVVRKTLLTNIRKNVLDSISELKQTITLQHQELEKKQAKIDTLHQRLKYTEEDLAASREKEDNIKFFGSSISKSSYNTILFSIIGILLLIGGFLFYKFLTSHKVINAAELRITEMEIEIEDYRRNSLEREQKLRRKLQDEINKNRKLDQ